MGWLWVICGKALGTSCDLSCGRAFSWLWISLVIALMEFLGIFRETDCHFGYLVNISHAPPFRFWCAWGGVVVWLYECSLMLVVLSHGSWLLSCVGMKAMSKSYLMTNDVVIRMWASIRMAFS